MHGHHLCPPIQACPFSGWLSLQKLLCTGINFALLFRLAHSQAGWAYSPFWQVAPGGLLWTGISLARYGLAQSQAGWASKGVLCTGVNFAPLFRLAHSQAGWAYSPFW